MIQEKKFLSIKLKPVSLDINSRWYLECYELTHNGTRKKRTFIYGNINTGRTVDERLDLANALMTKCNVQKNITVRNTVLHEVLQVQKFYLRPKSLSSYETVVKSYEKFLNGRDDRVISAKVANSYFEKLLHSGININTIPKYRNILHSLYNKAIERGLCYINPIDKVKSVKSSPVSLQYFSDGQIKNLKRIISRENPQLWLSIQLLFYCFIRPGEQRFLKINDINLDYGFIELRAAISKNKKTQKVIIPDHFLKQLRHLAKYPYNYYILGKHGSPAATPIGANFLNNEHKKYLKKLTITGRYSFYSWKHTGVVKCVQNGLNIRDIQNQLRHHSLDMVQEYLKNLGVLESIDLRQKYPKL